VAPVTTEPHIPEATRAGESVVLVACLSRLRSIDVWIGDELLARVDFEAETLQ
jgi:hypothetical protein